MLYPHRGERPADRAGARAGDWLALPVSARSPVTASIHWRKAAFAAHLRLELPRFAKVIQEAGIKAD